MYGFMHYSGILPLALDSKGRTGRGLEATGVTAPQPTLQIIIKGHHGEDAAHWFSDVFFVITVICACFVYVCLMVCV